MKKPKSASYDSDWLRENSEKEYGLPYEEALEMSYDNLRVAYDQLTQQKAEFFAEIERLRSQRDLLHEALHKSGVCPIEGCEAWKS